MDDSDGRKKAQTRFRAPKRITPAYLDAVALWYLGRHAATARSLEQVLMRRVLRSSRHHGDPPEEGAAMIEALIARYRRAGLIDDAAFAEARVQSLFRQGLPQRAIVARLKARGVDPELIDQALARLHEDLGLDGSTEAEWLAARRYAERRRLGPWRKSPSRPLEEAQEAVRDRHRRDLAAMARAGFSLSVARAILNRGSEDDEAF